MILPKLAFRHEAMISAGVALILAGPAPILAQGRGGGNGGGNGGGGGDGGDTTVLYDVLEVPVEEPGAISESRAGVITVAGSNLARDFTRSATYARVRVSDLTILANGFLPEPEWIDPDTGLPVDVVSEPLGLNDNGTIVGSASVPGRDPNFMEAVVWTFDGLKYQLEILPSLGLPGDSDTRFANAINGHGEIVGSCDDRAVYWDRWTLAISDLNNADLQAQGWLLREATDINDSGQIVGYGWLHDQLRGFLLDTDGQIYAAPQVGPAVEHLATSIDEFGRCIGWAWDGDEIAQGPYPDYVQAYSWDGPGTNAVVLPSVTGSTSRAAGMSNLGEVVGSSYIPGGTSSDDRVATLWEIDASGQVTATDLNSVIDSKWTLLRGTDCNNNGWIAVEGKRTFRGGYRWNTLLLIPRP